mmetsp:Transcript_26427/g.41468  ORF Transcript_26427/g.41468 Transcript_26427/m.41468 type:complete len:185 (+) Transcript_26427:68-622(+)
MTVTDTKPSAPPLDDEEIPVVVATAIPTTADVPTTSVTASVLSANTQPQPAAAPPGMSMVSKTTTYPDGRTVTITEYVPKNPNAAPGPSPPAPARPAATAHRPPRRDLGSRPCSVTCPSCHHTGLTKINQQCGACTWISAILLLLFCFPLFWVPFVCPSCYDTEHFCRNCGRRVGWTQAECCRN